MSYNIMFTGVMVLVAVWLGGIVGFLLGVHTTPKAKYEIKPYTGTGSGVLRSGSVVISDGKGSFKTVTGHIEAPGSWTIQVTK